MCCWNQPAVITKVFSLYSGSAPVISHHLYSLKTQQRSQTETTSRWSVYGSCRFFSIKHVSAVKLFLCSTQSVFLYFVATLTVTSKRIYMCIIPLIYSLLIQMHWSQWPQFTLASLWPSHVFSPIWTTAIPESSGTNRVLVILWSW